MANCFAQIPKFYFNGTVPISDSAYKLASLLLDRACLSKQNSAKWTDDKGIFIYFTRQEAMKILKCAKEKITKLFKELVTYGIITEKRRGQGRPNKIYVQAIQDNSKSDFKSPKIADFKKFDNAAENNNIRNHKDNTDLSSSCVPNSGNKKLDRSMIFENVCSQIDYSGLMQRFANDDLAAKTVKRVANAITTVYANPRRSYRVHGNKVNALDMQNRFKLLDSACVEYVYDSLEFAKGEIKNMELYLISSLYTAVDGAKDYMEYKSSGDKEKRVTGHSNAFKGYSGEVSSVHYANERHYPAGSLDYLLENLLETEAD